MNGSGSAVFKPSRMIPTRMCAEERGPSPPPLDGDSSRNPWPFPLEGGKMVLYPLAT